MSTPFTRTSSGRSSSPSRCQQSTSAPMPICGCSLPSRTLMELFSQPNRPSLAPSMLVTTSLLWFRSTTEISMPPPLMMVSHSTRQTLPTRKNLKATVVCSIREPTPTRMLQLIRASTSSALLFWIWTPKMSKTCTLPMAGLPQLVVVTMTPWTQLLTSSSKLKTTPTSSRTRVSIP